MNRVRTVLYFVAAIFVIAVGVGWHQVYEGDYPARLSDRCAVVKQTDLYGRETTTTVMQVEFDKMIASSTSEISQAIKNSNFNFKSVELPGYENHYTFSHEWSTSAAIICRSDLAIKQDPASPYVPILADRAMKQYNSVKDTILILTNRAKVDWQLIVSAQARCSAAEILVQNYDERSSLYLKANELSGAVQKFYQFAYESSETIAKDVIGFCSDALNKVSTKE